MTAGGDHAHRRGSRSALSRRIVSSGSRTPCGFSANRSLSGCRRTAPDFSKDFCAPAMHMVRFTGYTVNVQNHRAHRKPRPRHISRGARGHGTHDRCVPARRAGAVHGADDALAQVGARQEQVPGERGQPCLPGGSASAPIPHEHKAFADGEHRVCSLDVGINTAATVVIVDSTGTVIASRFFTCGRHLCHRRLNSPAYFRASWTPVSADRGRHFR